MSRPFGHPEQPDFQSPVVEEAAALVVDTPTTPIGELSVDQSTRTLADTGTESEETSVFDRAATSFGVGMRMPPWTVTRRLGNDIEGDLNA